MRDYNNIEVTQEHDILRVAFDRPEDHNAVNTDMHRELSYVFREVSETDARVVVLTGNGESFSSGGDVSEMKDRVDSPNNHIDFEKSIEEAEKYFTDLINLKKPIVAKINGDAIGLGATLALFCDIVIAVEDAKFGDPHIQVGLSIPAAQIIWPLLVDIHTAKEFLLTGKITTAKKAEELGLINYAVPENQLNTLVDDTIESIASGPQLAIRYSKSAINNWMRMAGTQMLREGLAMEAITQKHIDHSEAIRAFINDREPDFPSGR
jgi:enoyl-CoA hydratase